MSCYMATHSFNQLKTFLRQKMKIIKIDFLQLFSLDEFIFKIHLNFLANDARLKSYTNSINLLDQMYYPLPN
jgi:hypothetical protein